MLSTVEYYVFYYYKIVYYMLSTVEYYVFYYWNIVCILSADSSSFCVSLLD